MSTNENSNHEGNDLSAQYSKLEDQYKDHMIMDRTYEALLNGRSYVFNSEQEAASFAKLWKCCYRLKDADHERYKCASIRMERHSLYYEQQHKMAQYQRLK